MSAQVVIIGAGYAGVSAAKRLARSSAHVTMVNPRADFVERIRLHQMLVGNRAATVPLSVLLPRSATLVQDSATLIDTEEQTVMLSDGSALDFDHLIYAVGSGSRLDALPGASEHAVTVGGVEETILARDRLKRLPSGSSITVAGGGLTGVEVTSELAELNNYTVRLVTDALVASTVSDKSRNYLRRCLDTLCVELIENTAIAEIQRDKVVLADGRALDSDLSVMTAMVELPTLARDSGLATDSDGALRVSRSLISTNAPTVAGAGDSARINADPMRMSCQVAIPLGTHAAETVLHLVNGTEPKPVRPKFTGQCISLGQHSALWQQTTRADTPLPLITTAKAGALIKEQICTSTIRFALNPKLGRLTYSWS